MMEMVEDPCGTFLAGLAVVVKDLLEDVCGLGWCSVTPGW